MQPRLACGGLCAVFVQVRSLFAMGFCPWLPRFPGSSLPTPCRARVTPKRASCCIAAGLTINLGRLSQVRRRAKFPARPLNPQIEQESDCAYVVKEYVEELYLYSSVAQAEEFGMLLLSKLREEVSLGGDIRASLTYTSSDEFGVIESWNSLYTASADDPEFVLTKTEFKIRTTAVDQCPDELSMLVYAKIRDLMGHFPRVEYFSLFSESAEE